MSWNDTRHDFISINDLGFQTCFNWTRQLYPYRPVFSNNSVILYRYLLDFQRKLDNIWWKLSPQKYPSVILARTSTANKTVELGKIDFDPFPDSLFTNIFLHLTHLYFVICLICSSEQYNRSLGSSNFNHLKNIVDLFKFDPYWTLC